MSNQKCKQTTFRTFGKKNLENDVIRIKSGVTEKTRQNAENKQTFGTLTIYRILQITDIVCILFTYVLDFHTPDSL